MKTDVEYLEFLWPMRHYLITCGDIEGKANIIAISFCMPVSKEPPLIACAIGRAAYSCSVIERTQEFVVNVPPRELKPQLYYCGYHSGYDVDKFKATGLTPLPARAVNVPIIAECVAWMECSVREEIETGDKNLYALCQVDGSIGAPAGFLWVGSALVCRDLADLLCLLYPVEGIEAGRRAGTQTAAAQ